MGRVCETEEPTSPMQQIVLFFLHKSNTTHCLGEFERTGRTSPSCEYASALPAFFVIFKLACRQILRNKRGPKKRNLKR